MPQVQIQTPYGNNYKIDSSDPELIGRWFAELLAREGPQSQHYEQFLMRVWPIHMPATTDRPAMADWCVNSTHGACHELTFPGTLDGLIGSLTELSKRHDK